MEIIDAVKKAIQDMVVPGLEEIKSEYREIKGVLEVNNSRLSDINAHLIDQSRRIDELSKRMDDLSKRMDDLSKRMDDLSLKIDGVNSSLSSRIDEVGKRMDRLYEVIVRRDEHTEFKERVFKLEAKVGL